MIRAALLAASLIALPLPTWAAGLADLSPTEIAGLIDATSFPNSIGPRRQDGLKTFEDYGFTTVELVEGRVELYEDDRSWMFGVTVLGAEDDRAVLCILDSALGGPSYRTQDARVFALRDDGLLAATGEEVVDPACPHMGE